MAKFIAGGGISTISGSVAGTTYSRNANGAYIRNKGLGSNANTVAQQVSRASFTAVSRAWKGISSANRSKWVNEAANFPETDRLGQNIFLTGFQFYQKVNSLRLQNGLALLAQPGPSLVIASVVGLPITITAGPTIKVDVHLSDAAVVVPANTICILSATRGLSQGVYRPKAPMFRKLLTVAAGASLVGVDLSAEYANIFGIPDATQKVYLSAKIVAIKTAQEGVSLTESFIAP